MKCPIYALRQGKPYKKPTIVALPYAPIDDKLRELVASRAPAAIIPPYSADGDWNFTVRSAVTTRGQFPNHRVMVALPGKDRYEVRRYMSTLQADGFDAFALPHEINGKPVGHLAGFWEMSGILKGPIWYHIAGGSTGPVADVKGFWSWSEEGL
jgi:hypothetical protein